MRIVFIGTVEFSKDILERLINLRTNIVGIATKRSSNFNADFVDLSDIAKNNHIPYKYVTDINSGENIDWIKKLRPHIIFCFGFSQIFKKEILDIAPMGIIGFHPAKLPRNRGRHPIIWALVLGLEKTASTFFFMDEGIDSGDILSQEEVEISYEDNAHSLYNKITNIALKQIEDFLPKLESRTFNKIPQGYTESNYWRKRGKKDSQIDFRVSSRAIYNLVRALTKPYIGAHLLYKNREIKIWEAEEMTELNLNNIEYGKVMDVINTQVLVKCYDNAILLTEHEFEELPKVGECLL